MFNNETDTLKNYSEETLIQHIKEWLGTSSPPSPFGIGDDCAVFSQSETIPSIVSTDALIYGRHFDDSIKAYDAGRKLTLRNLSDIAAMGGSPAIATLSIITSKTLGHSWLAEFYRGIKSVADHYALKIVGGDLSALEGEHFQAVMTIIGSAKNPILRHSAKPNDYLYVTGHLGGSITGKHFDFTPRLKEGAWLSQQGCTTSMVDITDGLSKELKYLLSKNTAASIDLNRIPIAEHIQNDPSKNREKILQHAFCDGEDYELLISIDAKTDIAAFEAKWQSTFPKLALTLIGTVNPSKEYDGHILDQSTHKTIEFGSGFEHF